MNESNSLQRIYQILFEYLKISIFYVYAIYEKTLQFFLYNIDEFQPQTFDHSKNLWKKKDVWRF